jgi:hypothetical protein
LGYAGLVSEKPAKRLDNSLVIEHVYEPDRDAMLAALRSVLGLPKKLAGDERCKT